MKIYIDWDGDAFINKGGVTPNLFPYPTLQGASYLTAKTYTDIKTREVMGDLLRRVRFGANIVEGSLGHSATLGFQQLDVPVIEPDDKDNLLSGSGINAWHNDANFFRTPGRLLSGEGYFRHERYMTHAVASFGGAGYTQTEPASNVGRAYSDLIVDGANNPDPNGNWVVQITNSPTAQEYRWSGFPVTPGNTYTFVVELRTRGTQGPTQTIKAFAYSNNSISTVAPQYGRVLCAKASPTWGVDGQWRQFYLPFTVPGAVSSDHAMLTLVGAYDLQVRNLMLLDGNQNPEGRSWDMLHKYREDNFSVVLEPDQDYTFSLYMKSANVKEITWNAWDMELGTTNRAKVITDQVTELGSSWSRYSFYFPSKAYRRGFYMRITNPLDDSGNPLTDWPSEEGSVDIMGYMLTPGTTLYPFSAGPIPAWDDISPYVKSVRIREGKQDFGTPIAYEGTAEIILNNNDRIFSPENTESPLYGYVGKIRRVFIYKDDELLWTGWTRTLSVVPGRTTEREATINCEQGLFRLREGEFQLELLASSTLDEIFKTLVLNSGWQAVYNPYQSTLGLDSRLGFNTFLNDESYTFDIVDPGVNNLKYVGMIWGRDTDIATALEELLLSENAHLWITREGRLRLANRDFWINRNATWNITLDTRGQRANYRYGEEVYNLGEVTYRSFAPTGTGFVWSSPKPIRIDPRKTKAIPIQAEIDRNVPLAVVEFNIEDSTINYTIIDPPSNNGNAPNESDARLIKADITNSNGRSTLRITNGTAWPIWATVSLHGNYVEQSDPLVATYEDTAAMAAMGAVIRYNTSTEVLGEEDQARSMVEVVVRRTNGQRGEIRTCTFFQDDTYPAIKLGDVVRISEIQSATKEKLHAVIGMEWEYRGTYLEQVIQLAQIDEPIYTQLDTSIVGTTTVNLLDNIEDSRTIMDGGYRNRIFHTGMHPNNWLYLAPSAEQVRTLDRIYYWSRYSSTGEDQWSTGMYRAYTTPFQNTDYSTLHAKIGTQIDMNASGVPYNKPTPNGDLLAVPLLGVLPVWDYAADGPKGIPIIPVEDGALYELLIYHASNWGTDNCNPRTWGALQNWEENGEALPTTSSDAYGVIETSIKFKADGEWTGFKLTADLLSNFQTFLGYIGLLQYSGKVGTPLDAGKAHYYTVWAENLHGPVNCELEVYDETGTLIDTDGKLVSGITKFSVAIPTGTERVWARFRRTDAQYTDNQILLEEVAITDFDPASPDEVRTPLLYSQLYV